MPVLNNERHELYAKHRARGFIPAKAATAAGYAPGTNTSNLENDAAIRARIQELFDELREKQETQKAAAREAAKVVGEMVGVGRSWVLQQLAENAQTARTLQDFKESNRALELIGKEFGMFEGASEKDKPEPEEIDYDAVSGVLTDAHDALPLERQQVESRNFTTDTALELIEGQVKKDRRPEPVPLPTGSETDVALMADTAIEAAEAEMFEDVPPVTGDDFS